MTGGLPGLPRRCAPRNDGPCKRGIFYRGSSEADVASLLCLNRSFISLNLFIAVIVNAIQQKGSAVPVQQSEPLGQEMREMRELKALLLARKERF